MCRCVWMVICWLMYDIYGSTLQCTGGGDHYMSSRILLLDDAYPLNPAHCTCDEQLLCRGKGNLSDAPLSGRSTQNIYLLYSSTTNGMYIHINAMHMTCTCMTMAQTGMYKCYSVHMPQSGQCTRIYDDKATTITVAMPVTICMCLFMYV